MTAAAEIVPGDNQPGVNVGVEPHGFIHPP